MKRIAIIGAGGCAREVAWMLEDISAAANQEATEYQMAGFLVSDLSRVGPYDSAILGDFSWLESNHVDALAIGIGTPAIRLKLAHELKERFPQVEWPALVHPSVKWQRRTMQVGEGVIISAGTIATVNVRFEPFCIVHASCTIGHEAVIGRGCVLNPMVSISGGVELGSGVLVGTGAQILQYLNIGHGARIGAGAVVTKDVQAEATMVGVPAKELTKSATVSALAPTASTAA
jgi:sugar O-acyltransferase (sialic acid O-acetyltransferase NeuD family)